MVEREFHNRIFACLQFGGAERLAVATDVHPCRAAGARHVVDAQDHALLLADNAVARDLFHDQTAIDLVIAPRKQHMEGCRQLRSASFGRVVDLPVGDGDDAGDPPTRHIGQRSLESREKACPPRPEARFLVRSSP